MWIPDPGVCRREADRLREDADEPENYAIRDRLTAMATCWDALADESTALLRELKAQELKSRQRLN